MTGLQYANVARQALTAPEPALLAGHGRLTPVSRR